MAQPNVLLVICDDLAVGDIAAHGNPYIRTPALDELHGVSARCGRHYSGPLCSPARASLVTGRYHYRTRVRDTYCGRSIIDPRERTLAQLLGDAGYHCGLYGKWHLGDCYPSRPIDLGFDDCLMHLAGGIGQPGDRPANHYREATSYVDAELVHNGQPISSRGYCTDVFTDAAIEFIEGQTGPWFAMVAYNAPHSPFQVPEEWSAPYLAMDLPEKHALLYGMVANIDHNVGRLRQTIADRGQAADTIVVFTSDHGPCGSATDAVAGIRYNCGLRDRKSSMYEGGVRVPCFWHGPGIIAGDIEAPTHVVDVLPTLVAAADGSLPTDRRIDGIDLTAVLGKREAVPERQLFFQWHRGDVPVRGRNAAVVAGRWKWLAGEQEEDEELYDLEADPAEQKPLVDPDRCAVFRTAYRTWFDEVCSEWGPDTTTAPPIIVGSEAEPQTLLTQNDWQLVGGDEGWRRDDHHGRWRIANDASHAYTVRVRFRLGIPTGMVHLAIGGKRWQQHLDDGFDLVFEGCYLNRGEQDVEAWIELDEPLPEARFQRFVAALYIELDQPQPVPI